MELLCFDLDNTLAKATKAHITAFQKAFKIHKLKPKTYNQILNVFSLASIDMIPKLYPKLTKQQILNVTKTHDILFQTETKKYIKIIPGVKETLKILKNNYKIAILSNANKSNVYTALKQCNIKPDLFDLILTADDIKQHKPHPEGILKAKRILDCKTSYMIGDSIYDIQAGKAANAKTIAVNTDPDSKNKLIKEHPLFLISSIKHLTKIL